jgi:hypothetical protein
VPIAAGFKYLAVNPAPVVADKNPQMAWSVFEVYVNTFGPGMAERIDQRFPAYTVHIVADD